MKINIIRLQDGYPTVDSLDTALLLNIEFVLNDEHCIHAIAENGILYVSSPTGKLRIIPRFSNAISIEVTE